MQTNGKANRQSIASVNLLLQIVQVALMLRACWFWGRQVLGEGREERETEGSTSGLESGMLTQ